MPECVADAPVMRRLPADMDEGCDLHDQPNPEHWGGVKGIFIRSQCTSSFSD